MKAAFDRPDSHVVRADGTRIWLQCTRSITAPQHLHQKVYCAQACTLYTADSFPSGPESRLGHRALPPHRHNTNPTRRTFFSPPSPNYKPQTEKGDPRKSLNWILGPIWWLRSAASRFKYTSYNLCQDRSRAGKHKDDIFVDLHEAAVAPPGLRAAHLHLGHFMPLLFAAWRSTADCCPVARAKQRAPRCHWLSRGRWAAWWAVLGTAPGYPGTSHTSPTPQTKLIQTYAHKPELISVKHSNMHKRHRFWAASVVVSQGVLSRSEAVLIPRSSVLGCASLAPINRPTSIKW